MARIRSQKPELRDSRVVASWPFEVRYFWTLLWGYLDDYGRGLDLPKRIAGDCFPHDDITAQDIDKWLDLMTRGIDGKQGPVCRYEVAGTRYVHAINWSEHQKPNRPSKSRIPKCPLHECLSEPDSEPLNGHAVLGAAAAAEQGSIGAAAPAREPVTELPPKADQAARLIIDASGVTPEIAIEAAVLIARERKHRNLPGLVQRIIDAGELADWLRKAETSLRKQASARASPACAAHGKRNCAECRSEAIAAA
jgi:hypothetical protein